MPMQPKLIMATKASRARKCDLLMGRCRLALCLLGLLALNGCGVVAFPFRVVGDAVKVVPVVGKPVGTPIHAVGDIID